MRPLILSLLLLAAPAFGQTATGDLGLVIEHATGSLVLIDRSDRAAVGRIEGLGDLSHATMTYSPDERFAYVFGRDGGLTKVDLLTQTIAARTMQAGNSIGGAISDDGRLVAVSNYEPGGVMVFDADTLALVADIPAAGNRRPASQLDDYGPGGGVAGGCDEVPDPLAQHSVQRLEIALPSGGDYQPWPGGLE